MSSNLSPGSARRTCPTETHICIVQVSDESSMSTTVMDNVPLMHYHVPILDT
jgi:hypothetical protein